MVDDRIAKLRARFPRLKWRSDHDRHWSVAIVGTSREIDLPPHGRGTIRVHLYHTGFHYFATVSLSPWFQAGAPFRWCDDPCRSVDFLLRKVDAQLAAAAAVAEEFGHS